ncbi:hypothetical protein FRC03_005731 [Tulasnella sp. 419]|nr:hypothetical protein FRC03_005731 [Tulasnella sp. 419]
MMIGWGALLVAGGVSYYWAKQEIDARRKLQRESGTRPMEKKEWYERLGDGAKPSVPSNHGPPESPPEGRKAGA